MRFNVSTEAVDDREIYITGNFNNWNPKDRAFQLKQSDHDTFFIEIDDEALPEKIEYKFTKGGWENVELDLSLIHI